MKNLLAFLAAAALTFAGVGWYLDWFQVLNSPARLAITFSASISTRPRYKRTFRKARRRSPT